MTKLINSHLELGLLGGIVDSILVQFRVDNSFPSMQIKLC